jgi:2-iminobutanoate/2-iminopropanoate deaminase|tara:strand:+ start:17611 stop:17985 length:375 start_codon:yes stop_codon:yes gene_type:complete
MKKVITTNKSPQAIGPYSQAILSNKTLYISGQIGLNTDGILINKNIEEETIQVLKNIEEILKAADMNFSNVVKTTIFLKNFNDYSAVNIIYAKYFKNHLPAREAVEVSRLPKDVNIEISSIAVI